MLGFAITVASDSSAAPILCKLIFTCPIVANMSTNGSSTDNMSNDIWRVIGPWGSGGATILVGGNSRCSSTNGTYAVAGNPVEGGGQYCWCNMDGGISGVWVFRYELSSLNVCRVGCTSTCASHFMNASDFRAAICVPRAGQNNICDNTAVVTDGACSARYIQCVGSKSTSNTAGNYTITCSE
jgi:hypothetical protein